MARRRLRLRVRTLMAVIAVLSVVMGIARAFRLGMDYYDRAVAHAQATNNHSINYKCRKYVIIQSTNMRIANKMCADMIDKEICLGLDRTVDGVNLNLSTIYAWMIYSKKMAVY